MSTVSGSEALLGLRPEELLRRLNKSSWRQTCQVLQTMRENRVPMNVFHASSVMSACAKAKQWAPALGLLQQMMEDAVLPDTVCYNAAIVACRNCGQWQMAFELFHHMASAKASPNVNSFNAVLGACNVPALWDIALALLHDMAAIRIQHDIISINSCITACGKAGRWERALALLAEAEAADGISYSAAISACGMGGQWQIALDLLAGISVTRGAKESSVRVCWNAAISACQKGEQWQQALHALSAMPAAQVSPDVISYNAAIRACEQRGWWRTALQLLQDADDAGAVDVITHNAAMGACKKARVWQTALDLFRFMPDRGIQPDLISLNLAMAAWDRSNWPQVLQQLQQMQPTMSSYVIAIDACRKAGSWQNSLALLREISNSQVKEVDEDDLESCYNATISCCPWFWALHLALQMSKRRAVNGITFGTVLRKLSHAGRQDLCKQWTEELRRGWLQSWSEMTPPEVLEKVHPEAVRGAGVLAVLKAADCTSEETLELLQSQLEEENWTGKLALVSRLDHQTSGVLPLAIGGVANQWLQMLFASGQVSKEYLCLCSWLGQHFKDRRMVIDLPLEQQTSRSIGQPKVVPDPNGKEARTEFQVLETFEDAGQELMLAVVWPVTGRMHQIRAHMASLGQPIVGDRAYGDRSRLGGRVFLHCRSIRFTDLRGEPFVVEYPLPEDLQQILTALRKDHMTVFPAEHWSSNKISMDLSD